MDVKYLSLIPASKELKVISNTLWTEDEISGLPTLTKQYLWVKLNNKITIKKILLKLTQGSHINTEYTPDNVTNEPGLVVLETSLDGGDTFKKIWEKNISTDEFGADEFEFVLLEIEVDNLRLVIPNPKRKLFPYYTNFERFQIGYFGNLEGSAINLIPKILDNINISDSIGIAGPDSLQPGKERYFCHQPPITDRVKIDYQNDEVIFSTPNLNLAFSTKFANVLSFGWDIFGHEFQNESLLCETGAIGVFPLISDFKSRISSEYAGGSMEVFPQNRVIKYKDINLGGFINLNLEFRVQEKSLSLIIDWDIPSDYDTNEFAALRFPFDLYKTITSVFAYPNTTGMAGLVNLPVLINAPNHGALKVFVSKNTSKQDVLGRVASFRTSGEIWFDLLIGTIPKSNGLLHLCPGRGSVQIELELVTVYPFCNSSDINWRFEAKPFYTFLTEKPVIGAIATGWLNGMAFRPEIGLFANNSVSDQALLCHFFYADIASYTPKIKSGPDFQQILRFSLDQYLDGAPSFGIDFHPNPTISLLNSVWDYLAGTGDWDWAYARVDKIEKHVDELIASEYKETGLFATARSGVSFKWDGSSSWWDSFTSGPFESYFNALGYIACNRMADLMRRLDRKKKSNVLTDLAKRIRENYFKFFYNPATKCIAQWVDKEGKMHDYICHAPLGAAIYAGLVNTEDSIAMLRSYLHRLETSGFSHFEYGLPLVLEPVPMQDHMPWIGQSIDPDGMDNFQIYQNGGVTLAHTYWIIMALYKTNMRSEATALLKKLSMNILDCRASGSLNSGVDWRSWDGKVVGYEGLLAEQFHILLSTINGYLGVSNSLDGLKISRNIPGLISNDPKSQIFPDFGFVNDTV